MYTQAHTNKTTIDYHLCERNETGQKDGLIWRCYSVKERNREKQSNGRCINGEPNQAVTKTKKLHTNYLIA